MAYMSQDRKKQLSPAIKSVLKQYGIKGSIAIKRHSALVVNIKSGLIDFDSCIKDGINKDVVGYHRVNHYYINDHYTGRALSFLRDLSDAMMNGNWDKSDVMTDYFNVGWYIDINIGSYENPYTVEAKK